MDARINSADPYLRQTGRLGPAEVVHPVPDSLEDTRNGDIYIDK